MIKWTKWSNRVVKWSSVKDFTEFFVKRGIRRASEKISKTMNLSNFVR